MKIRNISATGALVEGTVVPSKGSLVQLIRGGLIVHALVAWTTSSRCGLKFSGSVDAARWRATPTNAEQDRVDEVVRLVKAGVVPLPVPPLAHENEWLQGNAPAAELSEDVSRVSELLERLGTTLSGDREVVARHGTALQNLDIAMQILAALEAVVGGPSDHGPDPTNLASLRRSADQALNRQL